MKIKLHQFLGLLMLLSVAHEASADWMAYADFTSCPRKYMPNTSAQDGPFASSSACQTFIDNARRSNNLSCASYTCKEVSAAASNSSGASAAPGHQLDKHIGDAVAAGINGQISGADAVGLVGLGLMGNALLGAAAPETPQQAAARQENERVWAIHAAKAAEAERIKEAAFQMEQDSKALALLDVAAAEFTSTSSASAPAAPAQPVSVSQAFSKGFEHASSCISQNSGAACAGSTSDTCISDYRNGYDAGHKKYKLIMSQAYNEGKLAGAKGEPSNGAASANADGPCRNEWIQQYNRGHWAGRHPKGNL